MGSRIYGTMMGIFIGDALAMPTNHIYSQRSIKKYYSSIQNYLSPITNLKN
jgi:ADP-ribosylglycohydrolase